MLARKLLEYPWYFLEYPWYFGVTMRKLFVSTLAAALLFSATAGAESPVVLKVRSTVNTIDARLSVLSKSSQEKEIGGGTETLLLWKNPNGGLMKARTEVAADHGGVTTTMYFSDDKPVFAFYEWSSYHGPGQYKECRLYYKDGKPSVVRLKAWSGATGKSKATARDIDLLRTDPRWKEMVDGVGRNIRAALAGKILDD